MKKISIIVLVSFLLINVLTIVSPCKISLASVKTVSTNKINSNNDFSSNQTIFDNANIISNETEKDIENYNKKLYDMKNKPQIYILTIDSLNGQDIVDYSLQKAKELNISSQTDYGLLTVISKKDRLYRTVQSNNVAEFISKSDNEYHLQVMNSYFRSENYDAGIRDYVKSISHQIVTFANKDISKYKQELEKQQKDQYKSLMIASLMAILVIGLFLIISYLIDKYKYKKQQQDLLKRSQFNYQSGDKLYPYDDDFIKNDSWSNYEIQQAYSRYKKKIEQKVEEQYKNSDRYKIAYDYKLNKLKSNNYSSSNSNTDNNNIILLSMLYAIDQCDNYGKDYHSDISTISSDSYTSYSSSYDSGSSYSSSSSYDSGSSFSDGGGGGW